MFSIFTKEIKDKKWTVLIYCISGILLLWLYVALYPSVQKSAADVSQLVKSLPPDLNKAFGLDPKSFSTLEGLLAGKHFSLVWPFLLIALSVSLAGSFLAGEIENNTIGFLLAEPISRIKIFLGKLWAGILQIIVFTIVTVLAIFPLANLSKITFLGENYLRLTLIGIFFGLAVFGLSMLSSAIFSEKGKATLMTVGILLLMYVMNIIALLKDNLDSIKYFSFFYYFNYADILIRNRLNPQSFWVYSSCFVLTSALAALWFQKRDIQA